MGTHHLSWSNQLLRVTTVSWAILVSPGDSWRSEDHIPFELGGLWREQTYRDAGVLQWFLYNVLKVCFIDGNRIISPMQATWIKKKINYAIIFTFFTTSLQNIEILRGIYIKKNIIFDTTLNFQFTKANTLEQSEHVLTRTKF